MKILNVFFSDREFQMIAVLFPDVDPEVLQEPANVAETIKFILCQPDSTVILEVMVLPMRETSWP